MNLVELVVTLVPPGVTTVTATVPTPGGAVADKAVAEVTVN